MTSHTSASLAFAFAVGRSLAVLVSLSVLAALPAFAALLTFAEFIVRCSVPPQLAVNAARGRRVRLAAGLALLPGVPRLPPSCFRSSEVTPHPWGTPRVPPSKASPARRAAPCLAKRGH